MTEQLLHTDAWQPQLQALIKPKSHPERMQELEDCFLFIAEHWNERDVRLNQAPGTMFAYEEASTIVMSHIRRAYVAQGLLGRHDYTPTSLNPNKRPYTSGGVSHGFTVMARYVYQSAAHVGEVAPDVDVTELTDALLQPQSRASLRQLAREARYTNQHLEQQLGLTHSKPAESELGNLALSKQGVSICSYKERRAQVVEQLHRDGQRPEYIESDPARYCAALPGGHWNRMYDGMVRLCANDPRLMAATLERFRPVEA